MSISSAVSNIGSAYPLIAEHKVLFAVGAIVAVMGMNLRGVRESGVAFALPTYAFIVAMAVTLGWGLFRIWVLGEPLREIERRRPPGVVPEQLAEPPAEAGVGARRLVRPLQLDERRHERLRHEAPAEAAEVAAGVGQRGGIDQPWRHQALRAAAMKRRTLSGSFTAGRASTPEATSTA